MADEVAEHETSNQNRGLYVGVDPIYKNSASVTNRPYAPEGETGEVLSAFAKDTEDNEWNGYAAGYNDEASTVGVEPVQSGDEPDEAEVTQESSKANEVDAVEQADKPASKSSVRPAARK